MSELTDKELLEAAAKVMEFDYPHILRKSGRVWNPLTHDGDLMQYARMRGIMIDYSSGWASQERLRSNRFVFKNHGGEARAILLAGLED